MEKKTFIFLSIMGFLIFVSIAVTFVRFFVFRDYTISMEIVCNPLEENCFVRSCENELASCEEKEKYQYYKIIRKNASKISDCRTGSLEDCGPIHCAPDEPECLEILCTHDNDDFANEEYCSEDKSFSDLSSEQNENTENINVDGEVGNENETVQDEDTNNIYPES